MMDFRVRALRVKADLLQFRGRQRPNKALEPTAVGGTYFSLGLLFFLHHPRRRLSLSVRQCSMFCSSVPSGVYIGLFEGWSSGWEFFSRVAVEHE
jgi:hypothetical protein